MMPLIFILCDDIDSRKKYNSVRARCKEWFGYTIPTFKPVYAYIPLVSPLKKNDKMDGFNMGEDNQIKSIDIKNGKLRLEVNQTVLMPSFFALIEWF